MSEARSMFEVAKELCLAEECIEARQAIDKAKALYVKSGDTKGVADCYVLLTDVILCEVDGMRYINASSAADDIRATLKAADSMIEEELDSFRKAQNLYGEASMFLSQAKLNAEKRGPKKRQKALDAAIEAEKRFLEVEHVQLTSEALLMQACCHFRSSSTTAALDSAQEALKLVENADAKETLAKAWSTVATCMFNLGDLRGAIEAMGNALNLYRELDIKKQEAEKLYMLAQWHNLCERPRDALSAAKEALDLFEEIDYGKGWQGGSMKILALTYVSLGQTAKAKELAQSYLSKYIKANDKKMIALCNDLLSVLHQSSGEMFAAIDYAEEAVKVCKKSGDEEFEAISRQTLARAQHVTVRIDDAKGMVPVMENMIASAQLWKQKGNAKREAEAWNMLGELYRTANNTEEAMEISEKALRSFEEQGDHHGQGSALMLQAQCLLDAKRYEHGIAKAEEAAKMFKELKDVVMQGEAYAIISQCAKGDNDVESSIDAAKKRHGLLSSSPQVQTAASSFQMVADLHMELGEYQKALKISIDGCEKCRRAEDRISQLRAMITILNAVAQLLGSGVAAIRRQSKDFQITLEKGLRIAEEARALAERLEQSRGAVSYWTAHIFLYAGRHKDALEEAGMARASLREERDFRHCVNAGLLLADIYKSMDNRDASRKAVQESLKMARQIGAKDLEESISKRFSEFAGSLGLAPLAEMQRTEGMTRLDATLSDTADPSGVLSPAASTERKSPIQEEQRLRARREDLLRQKEQAIASDNFEAAAQVRDTLRGVEVQLQLLGSVPAAIENEEIVRRAVMEMAFDVLGVEVHADAPFMDNGLDSLGAVSFRNNLAKEFDLNLPPSVIFDYPTVAALSDHVTSSM